MSRNSQNRKSNNSPASKILNYAIILTLALTIILLCILLFKIINEKYEIFTLPDKNTSEVTDYIKIIEPEVFDESTITTLTSEISTTTIASEITTETTELENLTEEMLNSNKYDKDFFNSVLFIGDSIGTGLSAFGYMQPDNVFAQVGLNPNSVLEHTIIDISDPNKTAKTASQKAGEMQCDYICIMLGTNGLSYMDTDFMIQKMDGFIDELRISSPLSKIALLSIPPVTYEHESSSLEKLSDIITYNEKLKNLAETKECTFVDLFSILQDETGYFSKDFAENDGLHFLGTTYPYMLSLIQSSLDENFNPFEEETEVTGELSENDNFTENQTSEPADDAMLNYETAISAVTADTAQYIFS